MSHETHFSSQADINDDKHPKPHHRKPGEISKELQPYLPKAQKFIDSHREVFYAIAQDRSLTFKPGTGFYTDLKTGEVNLDIGDWKKMEEQGESTWQVVWSVCHEIGHFNDLREGPEEMLGNFTYMEQKAKDLAPTVRSIWEKKSDPLPEGLAIDKFLYGRIHEFYNILDDMYINNTIARRAAPFGANGSQKDEAKRLYRDFLFPTDPENPGKPPRGGETADYRELPKSSQFAYALLRRQMVPDQEVEVAPEVTERLEGYSDEIARRHGTTLQDEVTMITNSSNAQAKNPGWRYERIKKNIEGAFIELLLKDIEEQPVPKFNPESGEGESSDEGQEGQQEESKDSDEQKDSEKQNDADSDPKDSKKSSKDPWKSMNEHTHIDKEAIENFLNEQKEKEKDEKEQKKEKDKKKRLTPEERAKEAQKQALHKIAKEHNIDPQFAQEYQKLEESVRPYKEEMAQVFEQLMNTISQQIRSQWMEGFRSGKFNTDRFVRKYGPLLAADRSDLIPWEVLDTFDQQEFESRLTLFPDNIRTRLVVDGSGSMDAEKILAVKQLSVLFFEGLSTFEETMKLRFKLKDPVLVDTQVIMFGSPGQSKIVKDFGHDSVSHQEESADRLRALSQINNGYGQTCDAEPMWFVADDIDERRKEKLKSGKAKEFVFEITDGGSNQTSERGGNASPTQDTRNAIEATKQKGAFTRAFQVGAVGDGEKQTFDAVWGSEGEHIAHPKDLPRALAGLLAEEMLRTPFMMEVSPDDV